MSIPEQEHWPEHAVCARCGSSLADGYRESPLGLRFCVECFDGTVQEKARQRSAEIYLHGRCSSCGRSLINGYRLSKLGVVYCIGCYENRPQPKDWAHAPETSEAPSSERQKGVADTFAGPMLWTGLIASHLLFFLELLRPLLPHPDAYLRALVGLDFLSLLVLAFSRGRSDSASRVLAVWNLLIGMGFIILCLREVIALAGLTGG